MIDGKALDTTCRLRLSGASSAAKTFTSCDTMCTRGGHRLMPARWYGRANSFAPMKCRGTVLSAHARLNPAGMCPFATKYTLTDHILSRRRSGIQR